MESERWDMQEALAGGRNPFDLDTPWDLSLLPDLTPAAQGMVDTGNEPYGQVASRQAEEYAGAVNTAPDQDNENSCPDADTRMIYKPCRKKPVRDQKPKEEEEDVMVKKDSKKGTTRLIRGLLHWHDPKDDQWIPAVIHDDIRGELIAEAQAAYPGRRYVHPDPGSGRLYDQTSFKVEHENWGPERGDRPSICFQWEKDENQTDHIHPGYMTHKGLLVLGPHDKPITNWPEIPATLSSGTPGYKLEAMRRQNMEIKQGDFWARMPRVLYELHNDHHIPVALRDVNTMINMPLLRFRATAGCLSWTTRDGTSGLKTGLLKMFAKRGFDPVANGNSTRRFRDLLPFEQDQVKAENADGRYEKQAGNRKISPEKRAELQKRKEARWARAEAEYQRQLAEEAKDGKQRNVEEDVEDESEVARPAKRTRQTPERGARKTVGPTINIPQQLEVDQEISGHGASGPFPPYKKSKGLLQKAVNNNASQHRAKADAAPVFDTSSSGEDVPLIMRRKQQPKAAAPNSEDSHTPLIITAGRRQAPAAPISNSYSETNAAPNKGTKRKRPAADAGSDDDTDFVPRGGKRHRRAAPVIESDSDSDSDPDPIVVNPRKRRRTREALVQQNLPVDVVLPDLAGTEYAHGTANYNEVLYQLQRANKRMRDDLRNHPDDGETRMALPANRQRNIQETTKNASKSTGDPLHKTKKARHLSRPHTQSHSQQNLGDFLAGKVAKVIDSFTPADLNPLQTAPTTERYYDQVAEALQPTINAYLDLTGYEAPQTNRWDSYATQWQRIYNSFRFNWGMITDKKLPRLVRLSPRSQLDRRSREYCGARFN
ncbi:hypothetical protein N7G274_010351 [Stereocaulon virgatum]|uniref:Uncharacterized protein n=1 Tax=Stereocaulon virgatum TaxID=373712 RepID=A0ABR3ZVK2_9LECA